MATNANGTVVDLDVVSTAEGLIVYQLSDDGTVRETSVPDEVWRDLRTSEDQPKLVSLAVEVSPSAQVLLFGVTNSGSVLERVGASDWIELAP